MVHRLKSLPLKKLNRALKEIIGGLYYPDCPYAFSVFPADILGHVYEHFLGKVIRLTAGHRAIVDDKPEVKKAGGVFYTPTYIVDYIVKNTVGKLLEDKTPKQAAALWRVIWRILIKSWPDRARGKGWKRMIFVASVLEKVLF